MKNQVIWPYSHIAPSSPMDLAAKQNRKRALAKIVSDSQKTSESYKTRENAFYNTRATLGEFSDNSQKIS